jgi:hypothetical protein
VTPESSTLGLIQTVTTWRAFGVFDVDRRCHGSPVGASLSSSQIATRLNAGQFENGTFRAGGDHFYAEVVAAVRGFRSGWRFLLQHGKWRRRSQSMRQRTIRARWTRLLNEHRVRVRRVPFVSEHSESRRNSLPVRDPPDRGSRRSRFSRHTAPGKTVAPWPDHSPWCLHWH